MEVLQIQHRDRVVDVPVVMQLVVHEVPRTSPQFWHIDRIVDVSVVIRQVPTLQRDSGVSSGSVSYQVVDVFA